MKNLVLQGKLDLRNRKYVFLDEWKNVLFKNEESYFAKIGGSNLWV